MQLQTLLLDIKSARVVQGVGDVAVEAIAYDSRRVERGTLFVAVPGFETDGHRFLPEALERGAAAVLVQEDRRALWEPAVAGRGVAVAVAEDARRALADIAAAFHGYPARELRVIGVTGTKGKTTTAYLTNAILEAGGASTGLLSSVEFKIGPRFTMNSAQVTTPESLEVQSLLAQMRDAATEYAVVESTSHGLALHRLEHGPQRLPGVGEVDHHREGLAAVDPLHPPRHAPKGGERFRDRRQRYTLAHGDGGGRQAIVDAE